MKLEIDIQKKHFYVILTVLVLISAFVVVTAYNSGQAPSLAGHDSNEIEVVISDETMTLQQAIDNNKLGGVPNNWDCQINSLDSENQIGSLDCPENYGLVSGGCQIYGGGDIPDLNNEDLMGSYPLENGWYCMSSAIGRSVRVYTYCCK